MATEKGRISMKIKQSIGLLMICLMLTSCIPTEEIEELGIITARGIDYLEEHQLQTTLIIFQFEAQSQNFTKIVSGTDRKSTRLNSSHVSISYAVFCLKKKKKPL